MMSFSAPGLITIFCLLLSSSALNAQPYERPAETDPSIVFNTINYDGLKMHYASAGDTQKPGILFIHGTPGSWPAFEMYLSNATLQKDFFMVSVDRPGWGKSTNKLRETETVKSSRKKPLHNPGKLLNFAVQAQSIAAVLKQYPAKKWLLVGHSLGASIAPKVALSETGSVTGMLLLAGSLDPKLGRPRWFNRAANSRLVKWLLPAELKYSNDEIMVLRKELESLELELAERKLATEVVIMQGMKDKLVSPKNPGYVKRVWPQSFADLRIIELPEAGHFLPWRETEMVIETIRQFEF